MGRFASTWLCRAFLTIVLLLASAFSVAQLYELDSYYELEVVAGDLTPEALLEGRHALVFFLPSGCPACDALADAQKDLEAEGYSLTYVTHAADPDELLAWIERFGAASVVIDHGSKLGYDFRVADVPSVYMVSEGRVVNVEYWPFFEGFPGLESTLRVFGAGAFESTVTIIENLVGADTRDFVLLDQFGESAIHSSPLTTGVYIICELDCEVCAEEAEYLVGLGQEVLDGLQPLRVLLVLDDEFVGTQAIPSYWASSPFELFTVPRAEAGVLATGVSPTHVVVGAGGDIEWVHIGFYPGLETRFVASQTERQ